MRSFLAFCLIALNVASASAGPRNWYVVLGSFRQENDGEMAAAHLRKSVAKCGVDASMEYTVKMPGFRSGYVATFTGPFATRAAAEQSLAMVKPCAPDAYPKQAEEGGE